MISGEKNITEGKLEIKADSITMPDGDSIADTIVSLRNRIYKLEEKMDNLKGES